MRKLIPILLALLLIACGKTASRGEAQRYVVLSPELAELIVSLGGVGNIVGVSDECADTPSLAGLPRVGGFGAVSLEKVVALKPTLVLSSSLEQAALSDKLHKLGIRTEVFYPHSFNELLSSIIRLGAVTDRQPAAMALADSLRIGVEKLRNPGEDQPRVYLEIYAEPLMSADNTAFLGDLLSRAGGSNIFPKLIRDYCQVKAEDVVAADPQVIIVAHPGVAKTDVLKRKGWERISACRAGRVFVLSDEECNLVLRAGPNVTQAVRTLRRLIHETP
jgi:iron complex transport system substrate-binding protein